MLHIKKIIIFIKYLFIKFLKKPLIMIILAFTTTVLLLFILFCGGVIGKEAQKLAVTSVSLPLILVAGKNIIDFLFRDMGQYYLEQWKINEELYKNKLINATDYKNRKELLRKKYSNVYKKNKWL